MTDPSKGQHAPRVRGLMEQEATEITEVISLFHSVISVSKGSTMHPLFPRASGITHDVIGAAMEVHKDKGPGLLPLGLVVHFHALKWTDGVSRLILPWANLE